MYKEKDKYQNILNQLHELNRNIVLNENEKIEQITQKIDSLEEKITVSSQVESKKINDKIQLLLILISLINTFLLIIILFNNNSEDVSKVEEQIIEKSIVDTKEIKIDSQIETEKLSNKEVSEEVLSFNDKTVIDFEENEEFEEINPIIRKGTKYTCKGDSRIYKIPYTVEIKGKLYLNEFKFILQENSITKECSIKKELM